MVFSLLFQQPLLLSFGDPLAQFNPFLAGIGAAALEVIEKWMGKLPHQDQNEKAKMFHLEEVFTDEELACFDHFTQGWNPKKKCLHK